VNVLLQNVNRGRSFLSTFRHLGALGLFFLTILDSSPVPTFCGPDILLTILVTTHRDPWYEYVAVATVGSTIGAYITFRLARKATFPIGIARSTAPSRTIAVVLTNPTTNAFDLPEA
jgi:membrane protein YqaA with SNARE-associated domain